MSTNVNSFNPVTHVIFDMDGLLLDTERSYTISTQNVVSQYGKKYEWDLKVSLMGMKGNVSAQIIVNKLELPLTVNEYLEKVNKQYNLLFPSASLLPDTERLFTLATERITLLYGKTYPWPLKASLMGMKRPICAKAIIKNLDLPISLEDFLDSFKIHTTELLPTTQLLPGAERLVRHLHKHGVPIAIASGSAKDSFDLKTTHHKEFVDLFNHVVLASSDPEVRNGKPNPDVFEVCAKRFNETPDPSKCLVFEDAPNGVEAAKAAHMQVIMVPDERLDSHLTEGSTQVLSSLEEFRPELFGLPPYDS